MLSTCVILIILVCIIVAYYFYTKKTESYTSSSLANIGTFSDYVPLHVPPENYDTMNTYGSNFNPYFPASNNNHSNNWGSQKTVERLDRIDDKLLPHVSKDLTPYDVDVADPTAYTFQVHAPRVIKKDRQAMEADPVRGDIPINIYPDVPIIQRSQYNRDSLRLDGMFSEALAKQYDRYTGKAYFNIPQYNSHGATILDAAA